MTMRGWVMAIVGIVALFSLPAEADHRHVVVHPRPYIGFGYGYGYPFYDPWYSPWYGPRYGFGVRIGDRYPERRTRTERTEQQALKLYVYPAAGQSESQLSEDRYQCHVWAADQSGHDPTLGAGRRSEAEDYTRAFTACMEGRNYVVK
jgi:hypothetical protein